MNRRKWVGIGLGLAACGAYAFLTGGLVVFNVSDFGGQRNIRLATGLKSDVWLAPRLTSFGVPFVFHYHGGGKPFGLRIQIWDDSKQYEAIEVTEVVLKYHDGAVVRKTDAWSRKLTPYTQYNSSSTGMVQTDMLMLSDQIDGLVVRHTSVTITLKGHLSTASGEQVAFEAAESFEAESGLGVTTFWTVLAGC